MTHQIGIYDHNTGEQTVRDMTADEIANFEAGALSKQNREAEAAQAKADKLAILAEIGLTEEQAKTLGLIAAEQSTRVVTADE
jgi:hypothetical protein